LFPARLVMAKTAPGAGLWLIAGATPAMSSKDGRTIREVNPMLFSVQ